VGIFDGKDERGLQDEITDAGINPVELVHPV